MCGIVGFTGSPQPAILTQMGSLIAHRGPDDRGEYQDDFVSLGNRRLAIIDIEGGHQPFHSADGRYVLVYNGEIYNYRDLATELGQRGVALATNSDTEVLLYWLTEFGISRLGDLNGMFALALWDRRDKELLLARDRVGIKPLYFTNTGERFVFASEIKAILPWQTERRPNWDAIDEFLTLQNVISGHTFFRGVHKLPPGGWLKWKPGALREGRYWDVSFAREYEGGIEDATASYTRVLDNAVRRHLTSDVPVGSYLSSGFDSASVVTAAARELPYSMNVFTGAFGDAPYYDEREGSRMVAGAVGANALEVVIRPQDFAENIGNVMWHLDEPTLGTGALPHYVMSRLAAGQVKVVLTGHGGDELFAGYQVNKVAWLKQTAAHSPWQLLSVLARIRPDEWTRVLYYLLFPLIFPEVRHGHFIMTAKGQRKRVFSPDFLDRAKHGNPLGGLRGLIDGKGYSPVESLLALYLKGYLPTLFAQEDRMGMAHSLEARIPLCDSEMIDLALALPSRIKLHGGRLKAVPRRAMRGRVPDALYRMPKRGFPTPFARWFRSEPVRPVVEDLLLSKKSRERGILNPARVAGLVRRNAASRTDNLADYARANRMYAYCMVELWFRTFMDGEPPQIAATES